MDVLRATELPPIKLTKVDEKMVKKNQRLIDSTEGDILLIDVSAIAYHIFYQQCASVLDRELPELIPVLIFKRILNLAKTFKTGNIIVLWDSKHHDRKEIYPTYKEKRLTYKSHRDIERIMIMKKALVAFRKKWARRLWENSLLQRGKECDDLMGILCRTIKLDFPRKMVMVANDGDLFQLLSKTVYVYSVKMDTLIDTADFRGHNGYSHKHVTTQKAVCGCSSDNVKGVGGIGEKKFLDLLNGCPKALAVVQRCWPVIERNMKLVALPMEGTYVPELEQFGMNMKAFKEFCNENGLADSYGTHSAKYDRLFNDRG